MSHRHRAWPDGHFKSVEELLADIVWLGVVQVHFLQAIAEGLQHMATAEQITNLTAAVEGLEAATDAEKSQVDDLIAELKAHAADQPDPAVDALIARVEAITGKVEGFVPDDAPPAP